MQRTEQIYDENDRLTQQSWYNGSGATSQTYKYSETNGLLTDLGIYYPGNTYDGKPNGVNNPSVGISYSYDALNRLSSKTTSVNGKGLFYNALWYAAINGYHRSSQVQQFNYRRSGTDDLILGFEYGYDTRGNIASEKNSISGAQQKYLYDGQNQLTEVKNGSGTTLYSYTYDTAGNLLSKTDGSTTHTYDYGNTAWADLLTSYDGQTISYDEIGNPTSYYNGSRYSFTWQQGRQLATAVKGSTSVSYAYDMAGVRSSKSVGSTTYNYITLSGKVMRQTWNGNVIDFIYDENNKPYEMRYKASGSSSYTTYYYILNVQGDVMALMDSSGSIVAQYSYDPWGKVTVQNPNGTANTSSTFVGNINPLRYRGYYYDTETGLYYLQSRYYDPVIGRFINADAFASTDVLGLLSTNMFAYCENNPINCSDPTGHAFMLLTAAIGAISGAIVGGIVAAKNGGNILVGIGTGAAVGGLIGLGAGAAAGVLLAGSATASTTAVVTGAGALASTVSSAGVVAGTKMLADNATQAFSGAAQVFWSGGDVAKDAARQVANNFGGKTLEMTGLGQYLERIEASYSAWQAASMNFANVARNGGSAIFSIQNASGVGLRSIWATIEYPLLQGCDIIYGIASKSGAIQIMPW